jgi:hypothetical protein
MSNSLPPNKLDWEETLSLTEDELAFFKAQTGIDDDEKLKDHIFAIQAKAHNVYPYPCIRRFMFTKYVACHASFLFSIADLENGRFRASGVPAYPRVLELAKERKDAILLDVGCCCKNA